MIKRLIATVLLCLAAMPALAYTESLPAGWDKLSETQKAEFRKQVAVAAEEKTSQPILDVKKVDEYVALGERIGKMMGSAAKELGIAVNQFVETPVGKWTMAMIIWKYMGSAIVHVFGGVLVLVVGFTYIGVLMRRRRPLAVEYRPELFLGILNRRLKVSREQMDDSDIWFFTICGAAVVGASLITIFTGA